MSTAPRPSSIDRCSFESKFTVASVETIEVPAGKFRAYKIESEGHWLAELAPNQKVTQGAQVRRKQYDDGDAGGEDRRQGSVRQNLQGLLVRTGGQALGQIGGRVLLERRDPE